MTLAQLRQACRIDYLGDATGAEDPRFTNAILNQWINDAHRQLAFDAKLYRVTKELDIAVGQDGVSWAGLPEDVIEVVPGAVSWSDGTREHPLEFREESWVLRNFSPLFNRSNGTPRYYFLRNGAEAGRERMIVLYPGSDTARANGLFVGCWIYPALLTDAPGSSTPAFQPAEHQWLVQQVVEKMAQLDARLGRPDAPVGMEHSLAESAGGRLKKAAQGARRQGPWRIKNRGW